LPRARALLPHREPAAESDHASVERDAAKALGVKAFFDGAERRLRNLIHAQLPVRAVT